jgi:hypothetical protein
VPVVQVSWCLGRQASKAFIGLHPALGVSQDVGFEQVTRDDENGGESEQWEQVGNHRAVLKLNRLDAGLIVED